MTLRGAAKSGIGAVARRCGLLRAVQSALAARGWFPILCYHRVAADPVAGADDIALGLAITRQEFEAHAAHLAEAWSVLPLSEARRLADTRDLPAGACAITFDDGWADAYQVAFPILRRFRLTATLFIATDYIDSSDTLPTTRLYRALLDQARRNGAPASAARARYQAIKRAGPPSIAASLRARGASAAPADPNDRMATWPQVRALADAGWEIGCHGRSHVSLRELKPTALLRETAEAKQILESQIGAEASGFCYPLGDCDTAAAAAVRDAGFAYACVSRRGWVRPGAYRYALPRILLGPETASGSGACGLSVAMLRAAFSRSPQVTSVRRSRR